MSIHFSYDQIVEFFFLYRLIVWFFFLFVFGGVVRLQKTSFWAPFRPMWDSYGQKSKNTINKSVEHIKSPLGTSKVKINLPLYVSFKVTLLWYKFGIKCSTSTFLLVRSTHTPGGPADAAGGGPATITPHTQHDQQNEISANLFIKNRDDLLPFS